MPGMVVLLREAALQQFRQLAAQAVVALRQSRLLVENTVAIAVFKGEHYVK